MFRLDGFKEYKGCLERLISLESGGNLGKCDNIEEE